MAQITGVGFSNFRVFDKPTFFDLAPITIFTGTNSSGKSSVFKGLKLLKDNSENLAKLNFAGEGHKLGTFHLAKSRVSKSDTMRFVLELNRESLLIIDYKATNKGNKENGYWTQLLVTIGTEYKETYQNEDLRVKIFFHPEDSGICKDDIEFNEDYLRVYVNARPLLEKIKRNIDLYDPQKSSKCLLKPVGYDEKMTRLKNWGGKVVSTEKLKKQIPTLNSDDAINLAKTLENIILSKLFFMRIEKENDNIFQPADRTAIEILEDVKKMGGSIRGFNSSSFLENELINPGIVLQLDNSELQDIVDDNFIDEIESKFHTEMENMISQVANSLKGIDYLEAIRANSQRLYSNQSQGTSFNELLLSINSDWGMVNNKNKEEKFINNWLKKFGIGDQLIVNRIKGIATEVTIKRDEQTVDLIDLGFGVTQLLPILIFIGAKINLKPNNIKLSEGTLVFKEYIQNELSKEKPEDQKKIYKNNGPLLLIEEPESNLHPKLQSLLADFFIDVARNFEVTLLIETHSEYLIRRLQVLTASGEAKPEDSVVYYLNGERKSDNEKQVTKININADGSLTEDFGPGFIDEATNWKLELMRLKNAKLSVN